MTRGNCGKPLFIGKDDHESFVDWLERVHVSYGWRVQARVLMGNHFCLLEQGHPRRLAKHHTAVENVWLAKRLAMGHSAHVSNLVNPMRQGAKDFRVLKKSENLLWINKD